MVYMEENCCETNDSSTTIRAQSPVEGSLETANQKIDGLNKSIDVLRKQLRSLFKCVAEPEKNPEPAPPSISCALASSINSISERIFLATDQIHGIINQLEI